MKRALLTLGFLGFASGVAAQAPDDELLQLEPVLRAAIESVAPSVVIVETFGGARRSLVAGGGTAADDAPKAPDGAKPTPVVPDPEGKPEQKPEERPGEEPEQPEKKRLGPLRQPGFLQAQGATTGMVLTADGWILVSRFALNYDPSTILITLSDGRSFHATRAGEDTSRGLALVKIEAEDLPVPEFVRPEAVRVGQWAFALGRTFGRSSPSVHLGVVSAAGRLYGRALQTDASTSPANYGGPLIDVEGRVLGVCVPLSREGRDAGVELYDSGIGFAVPIADLEPLLARMRGGEVLHRGWLGVTTFAGDFGPGALLSTVASGSAAEGAGLQAGDRVLQVDSVPVRNGFHLQNLVSARMGADMLALVVARGATGYRVSVTLRDLPAAEREARKPAEEAGVLPWELETPNQDRK